MPVNNTGKAKACTKQYGDANVKNTRYVWKYGTTAADLFIAPACHLVKAAEAVAVLQPGKDWFTSRGDLVTAGHYQESIDFANAHPDAVVPNPLFVSTKKEFKPLEFGTCMAA